MSETEVSSVTEGVDLSSVAEAVSQPVEEKKIRGGFKIDNIASIDLSSIDLSPLSEVGSFASNSSSQIGFYHRHLKHNRRYLLDYKLR